jgi:hypothetical protein
MTDEAMSPSRRRMIRDMTIRKFAPKTQHDYVQRVKNFAAFLGRSPDTASFEDVRRFQLDQATRGVGVPTLNQSVATLRFFFKVTLGRSDIVNHAQFVREPRKLPVMLSPEEVAWLLDAAPGLKPVDAGARLRLHTPANEAPDNRRERMTAVGWPNARVVSVLAGRKGRLASEESGGRMTITCRRSIAPPWLLPITGNVLARQAASAAAPVDFFQASDSSPRTVANNPDRQAVD